MSQTLFLKRQRGINAIQGPSSSRAISGTLVNVFSKIKHHILPSFSDLDANSIATAPPVTIEAFKKFPCAHFYLPLLNMFT